MIGGIGIPELLIILVIVLLIFGAGKLPMIGGNLGKAIKNFKGSSSAKIPPARLGRGGARPSFLSATSTRAPARAAVA
ncbi:MAG: twin-arginine translocase TatA/TatE family subunit [Desulfarculaceae bacterium]|nr:twin-arginine translocase TatA/TatE family subunit [Desulfarculaceae bacterium]